MTRSRIIAGAAIAGLFVWMFAEVLFLPNNFVYRDAAHFYYPLFQFVQEEWRAGRVPLWNPYENSGEPLLANSTSSVLYPGKLILALPVAYPWAFKFYILAHLLLAAGSAYYLARRWGGSVTAASVCALSYAFGGQTLFQYCNVVFLCGAAWLPLALVAGDEMLRARRLAAGMALGLVLALMVLAGDPQLAYEAGLLVALEAVLLWRSERRMVEPAPPVRSSARRTPKQARRKELNSPPPHARWYKSRPALLAMAACWGLGFSAVQTLPSAELSRLSSRSFFDVPRSLWEIPRYVGRDFEPPPHANGQPTHWYDGLLGKQPLTVSQEEQRLVFSVGPWRLAEYLWPNFSGRQLPIDRRWLRAVSGEKMIWTQSLYLGLLPLVLAVGTWRLRRADVRIQWLSWMVVIGVLGSFGSYGLGWLLRSLTSGKLPVGDEFGGLYWLLSVVLPQFVEFRYPGKLMALAAMGLSGLAAFGWMRIQRGETAWLLRGLKFTAVVSVAALVLLLLAAGLWDRWVPARDDPYLGPLDRGRAYWELAGAFFHTLAASMTFWFVIRWIKRLSARGVQQAEGQSTEFGEAQWPFHLAVVLTVMDLAVANGWMILSAPTSHWTATPRVAELIEEAERRRASGDQGSQPFRVLRHVDDSALAWRSTSSGLRLAEGQVRERDTLQPKYNMPADVKLVLSPGTLDLYDYSLALTPSLRLDPPERVQARRMLDALGTKYFIVPRQTKSDDPFSSDEGLRNEWLEPRWTEERPQGSPEGPPLRPALEDAVRWLGELDDEIEVLYNESHASRAWIVHDLHITASIPREDRLRLRTWMQAMLYPFDQWLDLRSTAWVEDDILLEQAPQGRLQFDSDPAKESCRITRYEPQIIELEAELSAMGLVVLAEVYYPGWTLDIETDGTTSVAPILRTNRIMRGALLPAGRHKLIYRYQPMSFYAGMAISVLSVAAALITTIVLRRSADR